MRVHTTINYLANQLLEKKDISMFLTNEGLSEIKKYRIIKKGEKFHLQRRFFFLFYITLSKHISEFNAISAQLWYMEIENFVSPFLKELISNIISKNSK